ncbi:hypothetical protein HQQ81_15995 [Microbacteriaceae bacterium VKM Ac-2854]|nr:hypothetical protein [Microbacteriaceae bacterium VKM Ac-2854]
MSRAEDLAVIGLAGRFPGAADPEALWRLTRDGGTGIRSVPPTHEHGVGATADLAGAELFDADFFGLSEREARATDPQQRLFVATVFRALEHAGHAGQDRLRIGVFGATTTSTRPTGLVDGAPDYAALIGHDPGFLATRAAYLLALTGPAVTVSSACSGSLAAVHLARSALLAGDCDLAVVGGVSVVQPQGVGYRYREGGILSPDGACRPFDARAAGTVPGSGVAAVVLRRLDDAVLDRDRVHAVLAGTAMNNDGADRSGFTAPSVAGQREVIAEALAAADVAADVVDLVEAHGTGTRLGDPIEVRALAEVYGAAAEGPPLHLHSVKANIGHLDAAAGVTGMIVAIQALAAQQVPAQRGFEVPNPELELRGRMRVSANALARPLRAAGVSSFGLGGTNVHAVLLPGSAAPRPEPRGPFRLLVTGRDRADLAAAASGLASALGAALPPRLDDTAATLRLGRRLLAERAEIVAPDHAAAIAALAALAEGRADPGLRILAPSDPLPTPSALGELRHARRTPLPPHPLRESRFEAAAGFGSAGSGSAGSGSAGSGSAPSGSAGSGSAPSEMQDGDGNTGPGRKSGENLRMRTVTSPPTLHFRAADDPLEAIRTVAADILEHPPLAPDDDLLALGLDSLGVVELATALRDRLDLRLGVEDILRERTVRRMHAARAAPPVRQDTPLFLLPPAGGSAAVYAPVARSLTSRTLLPLARPIGACSIRAAASHYRAQARERQPSGPLLLAGYSFGGSVALEAALQEEASGGDVRGVLLLDAHPPSAYLAAVGAPEHHAEAYAALLPELFPDAGDRGGFDGMFDNWRQDHRALQRWYPDAVPLAPTVLLRASEPENPRVLALLGVDLAARGGWASVLPELRAIDVPGTHYSMLRDPGIGVAIEEALIALA